MIRLGIGAAIAVALLLGSFGYGYQWANDSWKAKYAAERAAWIEKSEKAESAAAMQRATDKQILADYDLRIKDLQHALKDADRICFDGDDADRVRDLWRPKAPKAAR